LSLSLVIARLAERSGGAHAVPSTPYAIPGLWLDGVTTAAQQVEPYHFYHQRLQEIAASPAQPVITGKPGGGWSENAIIYNLFPRVTTAFDHNQDGTLHIGANDAGWRETGTLLKCIALLPYLKRIGFNTIHLLPITSVGQDGKKGNLGSPYGIRNPYKLDENLNEPALGVDVETLFAAFMEAAHHLGFRVVLEFVLRTSSKDGDIIKERPDWFYWIREDIPDRAPGSRDPAAYGNPIFPPQVLGQVFDKVGRHDFRDLPPPPDTYRQMFVEPPKSENVYMEDGRWVGILPDGTRARIPGAFADWPPDDNQPPWGDVTYLRMYTHPEFNYIAYNTIRMYDERSAQPQYRNEPLWDYVAGVIPHWQRTFGIDGVMIDMGHALPMPLKQRVVSAAREVNPDFAFWDENFSISGQSRAEGYNAVMGYTMFDMHMPHKVRDFLGMLSGTTLPVRFFAAPENHNTLRAAARPGGLEYVRHAIALCMTMPGMPFVLSGLELGETQPINTGLGFSNEQIAHYPADRLPLFSAYAFDWTRPDNLVEALRQAIALRLKHPALFTDGHAGTIVFGNSDNPAILVYTRRNETGQVGIIANMDVLHPSSGRAVLGVHARSGVGIYGISGVIPLNEELTVPVALDPGQVLAIEYQW
jgi:starch synthase (maltosyl-transferring)